MIKKLDNIQNNFDKIDLSISRWMSRYGYRFLRYSLGIIFIWFGLLKVVGKSPAYELLVRTVTWIDPNFFVPFLGWWEAAIGTFFLFHQTIRLAILLLSLQIVGTFLPLIFLPDVCYKQFPFVLTLEGQYIVKNLLIIGAAIVLGGSVRFKNIGPH